jgi:hypothetical protein
MDIINTGTNKRRELNMLQQDNKISRIWLYRVVVATAVMLMLFSFSMPWWTSDASTPQGTFSIKIFGYGLRHNMIALRQYIATDETPPYRTMLAWGYVAICAALAFLSTWFKGVRGSLLLGILGFSYLAYSLAAIFIVVSNRLEKFDILLIGKTAAGIYGQMGINFTSSLSNGFWLACASGGLLIILALVKDWMTRE